MCPYSIKLSFTFRAAVKEIYIPTFLWLGSRVVYVMRTVHVVHLVANMHSQRKCMLGLEIQKGSHPCLLLLLEIQSVITSTSSRLSLLSENCHV